jgi:hypothetical protein
MGFDLFGRNQKSPKGEYFRSNVWWWRPLAEYVYNHTNCVDEKDVQAWAHNDGHEVSEAEAKAIAKQLQHLISTGHTKRYAEQYEAERKALEKHNEKIKKRLKKLEDKFPNLAPNEYHPIYKKKWDEIYDQKKWGAHYPFSVNHVVEFAEFCKESGGFKIC